MASIESIMRNELTLCKGLSSGSAFNLGALHYTKLYHMWRSLTMGIGVALLITIFHKINSLWKFEIIEFSIICYDIVIWIVKLLRV
jgi:hypothetical protein